MTDRRELQQQLAKKVEFVHTALADATAFADQHGLEFYFSPGDTYGMGGTYVGGNTNFNEPEPEPRYTAEWYEWDDRRSEAERGWMASSSSC